MDLNEQILLFINLDKTRFDYATKMNLKDSQLIRVITLLASSIEEQRSYLIKLNAFPSTDELALEFDDAYQPWKSALNQISISPEALHKAERINTLLDSMSEGTNPAMWHVDSLNNSYWSEIRRISGEILREIKL
ncbi:hypothetical protein [Larkinella rosea]|uniref:Uncharacterized protein n=1 Tax=Larkinella rosea TaxID=2025312 RepID=A0A3P1BAA5_9BACT|nr:hypothetical protein [Larkinella rosea]RRA98000.1 hypothetical protein EHT25_30485 [Larkinella rosea]